MPKLSGGHLGVWGYLLIAGGVFVFLVFHYFNVSVYNICMFIGYIAQFRDKTKKLAKTKLVRTRIPTVYPLPSQSSQASAFLDIRWA